LYGCKKPVTTIADVKKPLLPLIDDAPAEDVLAADGSVPSPALPRARRRLVGIEAHQRRQQRIRYVLLFVSAAFMINALVGDSGVLATMKASQQYQRLQRDVNALREDNRRLQGEMERLKSDPTAIEEEARKNLGLIRPGETLVIVKDAQPAK
jgi:cell division protein FtsB